MFLLWMCDTSYEPTFYGEHDENVFIMIYSLQDGLELRERHLGGLQQRKLVFILDV